jgi:prevent-host-death family protein
MQVNMHDAKSRLSELVELARKGERVVIARSGVPVAEIVAHRETAGPRRGGQWEGRARIADDFDAPMPEVEELFGT